MITSKLKDKETNHLASKLNIIFIKSFKPKNIRKHLKKV
jgi:hypothetical protein